MKNNRTLLKRITSTAAAAVLVAVTIAAPAQAATTHHVKTTKPVYASQSASADTSTFVAEVVQLVNQERSKAGLKALTVDTKLQTMAQDKAIDMVKNNYFDHTSPTYGTPFEMMKTYGISYRAAGENIAKGQTSPAQVMQSWMNSSGHKANILSSSFTSIGVGYQNGVWVQDFIGK
ncbi:CAP domain-containing protein [Paenibacillus sp. PK4536]|uniref:CAP domain-containing protein n=1 Tax=unclassified Paenibacillus TaxID=185978 RepID=UPI001F502D2D|nr:MULTISPECIES: CAP domain-containing protein [unclassified Paenibacillus]WIM38717.1 CAP domain-containing protein [Paenibacillus sp. PK4536]